MRRMISCRRSRRACLAAHHAALSSGLILFILFLLEQRSDGACIGVDVGERSDGIQTSLPEIGSGRLREADKGSIFALVEAARARCRERP